jgi:hypothetical protein
MTASLPANAQQAFQRFITTEYTTVDAKGQPITWPVTPYYTPGGASIDITTGVGYPKKADDAEHDPRVALLFSDPTGSRLERPPAVLVQGTAAVDYRDLKANRERYARESVAKLPATKAMFPPGFIQGMFNWYFTRIYVHVRPERVFMWEDGDFSAEPRLFDAHMEEVRSQHVEEPVIAQPGPVGGTPTWDDRLDELGRRHETAVLSLAAPDGFPMSVRVPIRPDRAACRIAIGSLPEALPAHAGLACLCVHEHAPDFTWQMNFQVRGDLAEHSGSWFLVPHKIVGGFELPPGPVKRITANVGKMRRFRKIAKKEMARRQAVA